VTGVQTCALPILSDLYKTSSLGRYMGEQLIGELSRAGLNVLDVRKSPGLMVREGFGEYAMSRDMEELDFVHPAQAVVVGTYETTGEDILVNARILRSADGMVISSAALLLSEDDFPPEMLSDEDAPARDLVPVHVRSLAE